MPGISNSQQEAISTGKPDSIPTIISKDSILNNTHGLVLSISLALCLGLPEVIAFLYTSRMDTAVDIQKTFMNANRRTQSTMFKFSIKCFIATFDVHLIHGSQVNLHLL